MSADGSSIAEEVLVVALTDIIPDPRQPRRTFEPEALKELADSIKREGLLQPIILRPLTAQDQVKGTKQLPKFVIVAGERRWRASDLAGNATIRALVRHDLQAVDIDVLQLIENLQREGLPLAEEAAAVGRLVELVTKQLQDKPDPEGRSPLEVVAARLGKKAKSWVSLRANVMNVPDAVKRLVVDGTLHDVQVINALGNLHQIDPEEAQELIERYKNPSRWDPAPTREDVTESLRHAKQRVEDEAKDKRDKAAAKSDPKAIAEKEREKKQKAADKKRNDSIKLINQAIEQRVDELTPAFNIALGFKKPQKSTYGWGYGIPVEIRGQKFSKYSGGKIPDQVDQTSFDLHLNKGGTTVAAKIIELLPKTMKHSFYIEEMPDGITLEQMQKLQEIFPKLEFRTDFTLDGAAMQLLLGKVQGNVSHGKQGAKVKPADKPDKNANSRAADGDTVTSFLEACTQEKDGAQITAAEMRAAYEAYCKRHHLIPLSANDNRYGAGILPWVEKKRTKTGYVYIGLQLLVEGE